MNSLNTSHIAVAYPSEDNELLHPITLHFISNEPGKYLTMPEGSSDRMLNQEYFSSHVDSVNINHNDLFYSDNYFFKAIFSSPTFEDKIKVISDLIVPENHKETVGYMLNRFAKTVTEVTDSNKQDLISLYIKFYAVFEGRELTYSEVFSLVGEKFNV